jgi:hypothetical protein
MKYKITIIVAVLLITTVSSALAYNYLPKNGGKQLSVNTSNLTINNSTTTIGENNTLLSPLPSATSSPTIILPNLTPAIPTATVISSPECTINYQEMRREVLMNKYLLTVIVTLNYSSNTNTLYTYKWQDFYLTIPNSYYSGEQMTQYLSNVVSRYFILMFTIPEDQIFNKDYQLSYSNFPVAVNWVKQ